MENAIRFFFFLLGIFNKINIFLHRYYITQFQFILLQKDLEHSFTHFELFNIHQQIHTRGYTSSSFIP